MLTFLIFVSLFIFQINGLKCPNGSSEWQNACYFFSSNQTAPFIIAEQNCQKLVAGGHLASVHDASANEFLAQSALLEFHESTVSDFWIGASDLSETWSWTDGSNFTFSNWNPSANLTGENCGVASISDGKWNAVDCFMQKPYVCAVPFIPSPPPPTNPSYVNCGTNWFYFQPTGYCYAGIHGDKNHTWADAENTCQALGAGVHLVSIHSQIEIDFVSYLSLFGYRWYWIGLTSNDNENSWHWSDGTPYNYSRWNTGAPSRGVSSCVMLAYGGFFVDMECSYLNYVICKKMPPH